MLHDLNKTEYSKVHMMFRAFEHQPMCDAVLASVHPGRVFVDASAHPRTAFLTTFLSSEDESVWGFLVGNPDNDGFNQALNKAIFDREIIGEDTPSLWLTCHPEDWHGQLEVVFSPREPIRMPRRHYICREINYDWRAELPDGFSVHRMDKPLLKRRGIRILPVDVWKTIEKWESIDDERFKDFGFVTIHSKTAEEAEVAAYATVDFVTGGAGDAGFFTVEEYRRRGFGTITIAAALDYGLSHGLSLINWTCAEGNIGSIRTAEKLGLERIGDYTMHLLIFN